MTERLPETEYWTASARFGRLLKLQTVELLRCGWRHEVCNGEIASAKRIGAFARPVGQGEIKVGGGEHVKGFAGGTVDSVEDDLIPLDVGVGKGGRNSTCSCIT